MISILDTFATTAVPAEVAHSVQSLDRLKEKIDSGDYNNSRLEYEQCGAAFEATRAYAVRLGDENLANASYVFRRYFKVFSDLSDYFSLLDEGLFADSWVRLQDCLEGIDLILGFVGDDGGYELPQLRSLLEDYESLYSYTYFASSEYIVMKSHCSICGRSMQGLECPHRKGHLYGGRMASEVIDKAEPLAVAMVKHPKDKRCVITAADGDSVRFDVLEKFLALGLPRLQRFSIDERVIREENPDIVKTGRNQPCTCGSGLKFKRCCGRELYRERLDCKVAAGDTVGLHFFGV